MPAVKRHYFVINQLGTSADRRGPFVSAEAARTWADKHYNFPAWIVPAEPANAAAGVHRVLDEEGNPIQEG